MDDSPAIIGSLLMEVNGRLIISAGCNPYTGTYDALTSSSFAIAGSSSVTEMFCVEPDNIMDQEILYLKNFEEGWTMKWNILDDSFVELRDSESDIVIPVYTADLEEVASDPELAPVLPSASDGAAIEIVVVVFAMMTVMVFV